MKIFGATTYPAITITIDYHAVGLVSSAMDGHHSSLFAELIVLFDINCELLRRIAFQLPLKHLKNVPLFNVLAFCHR